MEIEAMSPEEAGAELPASQDLSEIPNEQLDSALEQFGDGMENIEIESVIGDGDETPDVEKPEETAEAAPAEEATPEVEAAPEAEAPAEEAPADPEPMSELDEVKAMVELSDLRAEQAKAENERNRLLADRRAGELDHLKKALNAREQPRSDASVDYPSSEYDEPTQPGVQQQRAEMPPELSNELNEIRAERTRRALEQQGVEFRDKHREFLAKVGEQDEETQAAFKQDFNAVLSEKAEEFRDALTGTDAKLAAVSGRTAYDSAITEARIRMTERRIDNSRKTRETAQASLIEQKRASSPTTGEAAQPPESIADKPLHELSDKELNALHRGIRY